MKNRLAEDEATGPVSITELLKHKLFADSTSSWFGSEVLYHVRIHKRNSTSQNSMLKVLQQGSDRYLCMVQRKDVLGSIRIVVAVVRGGSTVEFKLDWELKQFKALEFGEDENEAVFTFGLSENAEHSFFFESQVERDETSWILVRTCKHTTGVEVSVHYNIDLDALGYATTSSGTLARFPLLSKLNIAAALTGDGYLEEEAEAEQLLEEMKWTVHGGAPIDLQNDLGKQAESLQMEIIDFLLTWEDDEAVEKQTTESGGAANSTPGGKRVRETLEVLEALKHVDEELEGVDQWLGEQIEQLVNIQSRLVLIEAESSALETSWQNLSSVQKIVESLVRGLTLPKQCEEVLLRTDKVINAALLSQDLSDVEETLAPLSDAIASLRTALAVKGEVGEGAVLTPMHWRELQMMSAVTTQRNKLLDLSEVCCNALSDALTTIFDSILKHKALNEAVPARKQSITVKQFSFTNVIRANVSTPDGGRNYGMGKAADSNQALSAQRTYHEALSDFLPLIESLLELAPLMKVQTVNSYVQATRDKLYRPLLKSLFKALEGMLLPRHSILTLNTMPKFVIGKGSHEPGIKFAKTVLNLASTAILTPWDVLEVGLIHIAPIIKREEEFFQSLFNLETTVKGASMSDQFAGAGGDGDGSSEPLPKSKAELMLDNLFDIVPERVEKLFNTSSEVDGVETAAMLSVLQRFMSQHLGILPTSAALLLASGGGGVGGGGVGGGGVGDSNARKFNTDNCSPYLASIMFGIRALLVKRLNQFLTEQLAWVSSQKGDPKKAGVLGPVAKFPSLVLQFVEVMGGQQMDSINQLFYRLAKEIFHWLTAIADSNEKYKEIVKMHNYSFFEDTIGAMNIPFLEKFVTYAGQQRREAESKYTQWMITYEFPELSSLATRMEGVGTRVKIEELALYVRRKDVLSVVALLDQKKLEAGITTMRSRLEKHCDAQDEHHSLRNRTWIALRDRVVGILVRLAEAAMASYQISLDVSPRQVQALFDKFTS